MDDSSDEPSATDSKRDLQWVGTSLVLLCLGSLGLANVYLALTDASYFEKFNGWRVAILPFGVWLLTGFLVQGLTALWFGGIRRDCEWPKHIEQAWGPWCNIGLWLLGTGVAVVLAAILFNGLVSVLSDLDRGTALLSFLLLMILLALWRIGDQIKGN